MFYCEQNMGLGNFQKHVYMYICPQRNLCTEISHDSLNNTVDDETLGNFLSGEPTLIFTCERLTLGRSLEPIILLFNLIISEMLHR